MSLPTFLERYGSEAQCRDALMRMCWPGGFRCPHCGHAGHCQLRGRPVLQCNRCKHQASLTAGTLFARTHLPLRIWFLAIYLLTQHDQRKSPRDKNGISALSLRRQLGVNANTAWLIKHDQRKSPRDKLMQTMIERDDTKPLAGIVHLDDAYWGGEHHGGSTGRGSPGKTPFVVAVQITAEGFPMAMRMDVVPGFRKTALAQWAQRHPGKGLPTVVWRPARPSSPTASTASPASLPPTARTYRWSPAAARPAPHTPCSSGSTPCSAMSRTPCTAPTTR